MLRHRFVHLFFAAVLCFASASAWAQSAPFTIIITELETPLVPNSVIDLADKMGYYKRAGVDVKIMRVSATPSAVAALRAGQGDMANIGTDIALQLVSRDQMQLRGVISPDKALPYVVIAKKDITSPKQLEGRIFGIGRIGSVDYVQTRNVLDTLKVDYNKLRFLALGQPGVRGQALMAGQIDATTVTIGSWLTLPNKEGLGILVDQKTYYESAPFLTKLSVVTAETAKKRAKDVEAVVRATMLASRDFAKNPQIWIDAMVKARPDIKKADFEELAKAYAQSWQVNGGLDDRDLEFTTKGLYENEEFKGAKQVKPAEWIDKSFVNAVLAKDGTF